MNPGLLKRFLLLSCFFLLKSISFSQLQVIPSQDPQALAQKLIGNGVIISNATVTRSNVATPCGFFYNRGGTNINIDSGIVITNGRAKSDFVSNKYGIDGDGIRPSSGILASTQLGLPGDADLAAVIGASVNDLHDAVSLEFDVIPLGDTLSFKYTFGSEEYVPQYVCVFNDAFALLLSGPGIIGQKNLALVPKTTIPVTIKNVNNIPAGCINNPQFYVDNSSNTWFTYSGHTSVFTAQSVVEPCQTYHLKFVVADLIDFVWDTGVFLEAGSLSSEPVFIDSHVGLDDNNKAFVARGCTDTANIHIVRSESKPFPQTVHLSFGGTAINGIDVSLIASSYVIPANDSFVVVPVIPLPLPPSGTKILKIYISNGVCGNNIYNDSIEIEIRDYNPLRIDPGRLDTICGNSSIQLNAETGYFQYSWTGAGLNNYTIHDPVATPVDSIAKYICTAVRNGCTAIDSVVIKKKLVLLLNKTDIFCRNGSNGQITVRGPNWDPTVQYAINNSAYQNNNTFSNLATGTYWLKMKDASCVDSIAITLVQSFPDLDFTSAALPASCSTVADGQLTLNPTGGNGNYQYSIDGSIFQSQNFFTVFDGNYTVYVKDGNGCVEQKPAVVTKINSINLNAGNDTTICEGTGFSILARGNAISYSWSPGIGLSDANSLNPTANPTTTTEYIITGTKERCTKTDTLLITVRPAPVATVDPNVSVCFGKTIQLHASGGVNYDWAPVKYFLTASNIPDPLVQPLKTTTYSVNIKDNYQCQSLLAATVKVTVTPSVKIFAGRDTLVAFGQPLQLHAAELSNAGVVQFNWSPSIYLNNPNLSDPIANINSEITYTVTGSTPDGCTGADQVTIKVYKGPEIYVPSAFTPNNDGLNDILKPISVGIKEFHYLKIFNRWGQMIFSTKDPSKGWDGKINGRDQSNDTYVWIAEGVDYKGNLIARKGVVTVVK